MVTVSTEAIGEHLVITSPRSALNEAHRQPTGFNIQGGKQRDMEKKYLQCNLLNLHLKTF